VNTGEHGGGCPSPPAQHPHNHRHHPADNPAGAGADRRNPLLLAGLLRAPALQRPEPALELLESHLTVLPLRPPGPSRLHQEVEVSDAPLDERHPGVVQKVLDVHPPSGGEVVDDDDVVVLCQIRRFVRNRARAPPRMTFQRNGVGAPEVRGAVVPARFEPIEPARGESREGGFQILLTYDPLEQIVSLIYQKTHLTPVSAGTRDYLGSCGSGP
jgi:hypothetical protein